jgi:DNA invertase Pin-like site-specific DNA recombinase
MSEKIRSEHLQRQAIVYIRQSSPGQVKNHPESYRVQKGLVARAQALGWAEDQIHVVQGDQGSSASLPGNRPGFDEVLQSVQSQQVGIVLGQDASRLCSKNSRRVPVLANCWCGCGTRGTNCRGPPPATG